MQRPMTQSKLNQQLTGVADKLTSNRMTKERRLDLLRQQAALGDLRDERLEAARRRP